MADYVYMNSTTHTVEMGTDTYDVSVALGGSAIVRTGVYDVIDYGAARDGATDDSAAIQSAIDACEAAGGGVVSIPSGEYLVT